MKYILLTFTLLLCILPGRMCRAQMSTDTLSRAIAPLDDIATTCLSHQEGCDPGAYFISSVFARYGVILPPQNQALYAVGIAVQPSYIHVGDIVFFGTKNKEGKSHVIKYIGIVSRIDSSGFEFMYSIDKGVRIGHSSSKAFSKRFLGARRVAHYVVPEPTPAIPAPRPQPVAKAASFRRISVAMVGDMMLGTTYPSLDLPRNQGAHLFDDVQPILASADLTVGNLEGTMLEGGTCAKGTGPNVFAFRMPPSYVKYLVNAGFDFLSIANNHSGDFGVGGMLATMRVLDSAGIRYAGIRNRCHTAILRTDSLTYGFCAFGACTHNCDITDYKSVRSIVRSLRDSVDILIVSFHGGAEGKAYAHLPKGREIFLDEDRGSLREFAHICIDEGADIVFGHGPHVCRAIELYREHFIAYSLGNFCTPGGISVSGISGYAPVITVDVDRDGRLIEGKIHSFIQPYKAGPRFDPTGKVAQAIIQLSREDFDDNHLLMEDDGTFRPKE